MAEALALKKLTSIASVSAAKAKEIGGFLWKYLSLSLADDRIAPKKNLCVSIEQASAFITYGSRILSRVKLLGISRRSFEGQEFPQPEDLAASVALTANNLQARGTGITLSIPKAWAIIKTAELPSVVKENLSEVISYELDRLTPLSAEEAYYDFSLLGENNGKLLVVVAAARTDLVSPYIDALREKGLTVSRLTVNLSGIGTLCRFMDERKDYLFVEARKNGYEGALYYDGTLVEAFAGNFPVSDEKAKAERVLAEIESLRESAKKSGREPRSVVLLKDTDPSFKELLKLHASAPLAILNEADLKLKLPASRNDVSFASIGGVMESLWPKARGLNLLAKGRREKQKPPVGLTLVLLTAITALWIFYIITPFRIEGKRLAEIDRQIAVKKEEVKKIEALKKEIEALDKDIATIVHFKEDRPMTLNVLKELTTILPKTTWLTRTRVTEANVEIEGYASSATELLPKLETSKLFKKAEFASPTFRDARMNADRFIIKMEIEGFKKPEGEGAKDGKK